MFATILYKSTIFIYHYHYKNADGKIKYYVVNLLMCYRFLYKASYVSTSNLTATCFVKYEIEITSYVKPLLAQNWFRALNSSSSQ